MKIPNPWPYQPHIRFNVNNGACTGSCGAGPEIEVPDMAVEVLIEPVAKGRYDSETLAPGRVWSKEFGMLDVGDHLKKVEIKKEEAALKERQEDVWRRSRDEAKAAKVKKVKERTDKMYADVPEGMLVDPVTGANTPRKEEPREKIDVARAASGLAKVTKALKAKK